MTPSGAAAAAAPTDKPIRTTDKPFTPGSGSTKATAAEKPADKPAKKGKTPAEKLNERAREIADWATGTRALAVSAVTDDPKSKHAGALNALVSRLGELATATASVQDSLQALHKAKWEPPKARKKGDWRPGDLVALKPRHIERYRVGYEVLDLKSLTVLSVHGAMVKVQIERAGMKGEVLGLVPAYALVVAKPEPAAK